MATFDVKTDQLRLYAFDEKYISLQLRTLDTQANICRSQLSTSVSAANYKVKKNLSELSKQLNRQIKVIDQMAEVLNGAASLYNATERGIRGTHVSIREPEKAKDIKESVSWMDAVEGVVGATVGAMGSGGKGIKIGWDALNGKAKVTDVIKWLVSSTGAVMAELSKDTPEWLNAIWKISGTTYESGQDFLTSKLKAFFPDLDKTGIKSVWNKGAVVAQWLGVVVEGAINFGGNLDEFGDNAMLNPRFWGENIIETAFDVGKSIAIGTGIVAVAAAAGVSAPAWAIALGTGLIIGVADTASKALVGKDLTEAVTDGILDTVEWVGEKTEKISDWASERVEDAAGWVKDKFSEATNQIGKGVLQLYDNIRAPWAFA